VEFLWPAQDLAGDNERLPKRKPNGLEQWVFAKIPV
jgi:hypothetical protein